MCWFFPCIETLFRTRYIKQWYLLEEDINEEVLNTWVLLPYHTGLPFPFPSTMSVVVWPLSLLFIWLLFRWFYKRFINPKSLPLPPGPKPLPIIGNLRDMPSSDEWIVATEWSKRFGDLVHVEVLGSHILYVNSLATARDLFDKRSTVYSSRAKTVMLTEMYVTFWFNSGFISDIYSTVAF